MSSLNPDSNFADTTISFNKLKEEIDKNEDVESSTDKAENTELPKTKKMGTIKLSIYCLLMNSGWIIAILYILAIEYHDHCTNHMPDKYLEACNGKEVMSVDEYKLLKEDSGYIQDEIKVINLTIRHNLSTENPLILQEKLKTYTDKLNAIKSTLNYQKESQYECYKKIAEKYINENSDFFQSIATIICIFGWFIPFYSVKELCKSKLTPLIGCVAMIAFFFSIVVAFLDFLFLLLILFHSKETRILDKFPLKDL